MNSLQTINYEAQLIVWQFQIQAPLEPWGEKYIVPAVRYSIVYWLAPEPEVPCFANMFFLNMILKSFFWGGQSPQNLP